MKTDERCRKEFWKYIEARIHYLEDYGRYLTDNERDEAEEAFFAAWKTK